MARTVPKGAKRGPRNKLVGVYFSEQEVEQLKKIADGLGFRSKGALITYLLEEPLERGFSGVSFWHLGNKVADLIDKNGAKGTDWKIFDIFNPFKKRDKPIDPSEFYIEGEEEEEYENEK